MKEEEDLCQAFSDALLAVEDIDGGDSDMPQLCSEYVKDIYVYLRGLEVLVLEYLIQSLWTPQTVHVFAPFSSW